jgi:hypothetical protein
MRLRTFIMLISVSASSSLALSQNSAVNWWAMDMGYAASTTGNTKLHSAVGQNSAGVMKTGNTMIMSGFLADTLFRKGVVSAVSEEEALPLTFELGQNYPNPFNPTTTIEFSLPKAGHVSLILYDMLGREIEKLVDGELAAGRYRAVWNARGYATGMYVYRLQAGDYVAVKRLLLLK